MSRWHVHFRLMSLWYRVRLCLALTPLAGWDSFPLTERAEERMSVREPEKVGGFIQLKRGLQKVVACQFAARLLQQLLEAYSGFSESPLQSPRTRPHVAGNILNVRLLPCEKRFENRLHLLTD